MVKTKRRVYKKNKSPWDKHLYWGSLLAIGSFLAVGFWISSRTPESTAIALPVPPPIPVEELRTLSLEDLLEPVRQEPARFRARTHLPTRREDATSGAPQSGPFSEEKDLIRITDERVWWESDSDTNDTEDDHLMHAAMAEPMLRLIELVTRAGGTLEVHDAYRPEGVHAPKSLHREGRAVDLTCDQLGLEKLAKLAWAAGFDWVYYEAPKRGGAHVHASVKANRERVKYASIESY